MPPEMPRVDSIRVDAPVLLFTTCIALIATVAFGVFASRRGAAGGVRSPGIARSPATRVTTQRGSGSVVIAEIALGVVLTVLAGLMVRSFVNLRAVDLGFEASSVVTARISLPSAAYGTAERQRAFFETLGARVRMLPGAHSVSFATTRPFACCAPATTVSNPAAPTLPAEVGVTDVRYADSSYFPALRIPIERGQGFQSREQPNGPVRVLINRTLARALWGDANPVGQRIHVAMYNGLTAEVIGVTGDVHLADPRTPPRATVYLSAERYPSTVRDIIVRTDGSAELVIPSLRTALASVDPTLPLYQISTLSDAVELSLARDRFITTILSVFAAVSLLLAAVGIYGVFSGEVAARRKEIGVRLALGADRSAVVMLVLRRALMLSVVGAGLGCSIGLLMSQSMKALVYDVGTSDPTSFLVVTGTLLGVALLATMIPAVRAARTSPLEAIRTDGG
jgi:predicted permease